MITVEIEGKGPLPSLWQNIHLDEIMFDRRTQQRILVLFHLSLIASPTGTSWLENKWLEGANEDGALIAENS